MTPPTGVMFLTAMRRSAPCLEAKRQRRTSNPGFRGRWTDPSRVEGPRLRPRCRKSGRVPGWRAPDHRLMAVDVGPEEIRTPPEGDRPPAAAAVRTPFGAAPTALEGVDPTGSRTPVGQELDRGAETRMRVPPNAMAPPLNGLRASPSLGGIGSTPSFGGRRSFRPLVGIGAQPSSGKGPQTPSGGHRQLKGRLS